MDDGGMDSSSDCTSDATCDDGQFCNGLERCSSGACVAGAPACGEMACDESLDACVSCEEPDADGDGAASIACGGDDCDDTDPNVNPSATEVCDAAGVDEDCDPSTLGERDIDGDGRTSSVCCNGDTCGLDCDDSNAATYSGATEVCNGIDDDCDGSVDEGVQVMLWIDADRDGAGDPEMRVAACADTPGFVNNDDDCDDSNPTANPAGIEACDEIDNDCDGEVDEDAVAIAWYLDADGDGFGVSMGEPVISCTPVAGHAPVPGDCDDTARDVNPAAAERCNGRDDNCDGRADYRIGPGNFEDDDGDGFADAMCPGGAGNDCDDRDATVFPGAPELCDFRDNDCDGVVDGETVMSRWYVDSDGDGWGDDSQPFIESCEPQPGRAFRAGDCDDSSSFIRPGLVDGCDGIDQDCDGDVDENSPRLAYYRDGDGDGWGAGSVTFACVPPMDSTTRVGDCSDDDATRYPTAPEDCNLRDDDCDGRIDEGAALTTFYQDADRDGYGRAGGTTREACVPPAGFADNTDDCDDANPARNPGAPELCNNVDDNCDGFVDGSDADPSCSFPNGSGICVSGGFCDLASCSGAYRNCDGASPNGCEADTASDADHCGGCDARCPAGLTCMDGACSESPFVGLVVGDKAACAYRANGRVICWGGDFHGAVAPSSMDGTGVKPPTVIDGLPHVVEVVLHTEGSVSSQSRGGCARTISGDVWCWGNSNSNFGPVLGTAPGPVVRTGSGVGGVVVRAPAPVPGASNARSLAICGETACAVRDDGRVVCWGGAFGGRLGDGSTIDRETAQLLPGISDGVSILGGPRGFCVRRAGGLVSCWGSDGVTTPTNVSGIADAEFLVRTDSYETSSGNGGWCARQGGSWWCWRGYREPSTGELAVDRPQASLVVGIPAGSTSIDGSFRSTTCVTTPTVQCWGSNTTSGLLGRGLDGNVTRSIGPVAGPLEAIVVRGGYNSFCAIRAGDSSVWCWGSNVYGQLGDRTASSHAVPVQVDM